MGNGALKTSRMVDRGNNEITLMRGTGYSCVYLGEGDENRPDELVCIGTGINDTEAISAAMNELNATLETLRNMWTEVACAR